MRDDLRELLHAMRQELEPMRREIADLHRKLDQRDETLRRLVDRMAVAEMRKR